MAAMGLTSAFRQVNRTMHRRGFAENDSFHSTAAKSRTIAARTVFRSQSGCFEEDTTVTISLRGEVQISRRCREWKACVRTLGGKNNNTLNGSFAF
mmetsp:Transcript_18480/g.51375  ORF Transcript_18480/g.51375 Transcript_18480/m.51375 type:complete len:96 (-) Transcript_18480:905-1192(-)